MPTALISQTQEPKRAKPKKEIIYPDSDGKPMAETDPHVNLIINGKSILNNRYKDRQDVYVSGNNFIYYAQGEPSKCVSPDGYVVFGVSNKDRNSYRVWEENGKMPSVVFEYTSKKTVKDDLERKYRLYEQVFCVSEYFLFDPFGKDLNPALQGYRLLVGSYMTILPHEEGRLYSEQLGLWLVPQGVNLRFYDPVTKKFLRTLQESESAVQESETARMAVEDAARRASERAEREHEARMAAEVVAHRESERALSAETEIDRLRAELEALRNAR